jgi:hypothetical protein
MEMLLHVKTAVAALIVIAVLDKSRYIIRVVTLTTQGSIYTSPLRETLYYFFEYCHEFLNTHFFDFLSL